MSFLADVLAEETFYENLTLGLIKILEHTSGIEDVALEKKQPCERMQLSSWEQRHCCVLPSDVRQFYLSTDGFKLTWSYRYAGDLLSIGNMKINAIGELKRLAGVKIQGDGECPGLLDIDIGGQPNRPHFGVKCKVFEIDSCQGNGRVCLVYFDKQEPETEKRDNPKIWFLDRSFGWHFLADNFTQYFRMMLVHQGLPQWHFRFTPTGMTPFAEQVMSLVTPHLLQPEVNCTDAIDPPANYLDPSVFKSTKGKPPKKK